MEALLTRLPKLPSLKSFRGLQSQARRELRNAMIFISPWIFGFLAFTLIPMVATLVFTFMNIKITDGILNPPNFVGLENYKTLFKDMVENQLPITRCIILMETI